jgi:hypothetical protein
MGSHDAALPFGAIIRDGLTQGVTFKPDKTVRDFVKIGA